MIIGGLRTLEERVLNSNTLLVADLAVFRVLYALFVLVTVVPVATWLPLAPRIFFYPPIGPAALFTATPPPSVLFGLNVLLCLFAAMLLVGWRTGLASAGTGLTLLALNSWAYSLGKINHDILVVVTPLILGFSGWGQALSIDATRNPPAAGEKAEAWPLALLALLVGFAMFTAGLAKATSGWLNPQLRCTYGQLVRNYLFTGRETWAANLALRVDSAWIWKLADWSAVVLEVGFLFAAFHRQSLCLIMAAATFFHLGVSLMFDISFSENILIYGAFVRYTRLPCFRNLGTAASSRLKTAVVFLAVFALGLAATAGGKSVSSALRIPLDEMIVWLGAVAGVGYLFRMFWGRRSRVTPNTFMAQSVEGRGGSGET